MTYTRTSDGVAAFTHTLVPEAHEGKGVGSALVKAGFAWAESEGLKVLPVCPYVGAYLRRHPEHRGLVLPGVAY